nr:hypothetical protein [Streptomyces akebiae]
MPDRTPSIDSHVCHERRTSAINAFFDLAAADNEVLLMRHLVRLVREQHQVVDEQLAHLFDIDRAEVWRRLDAESGGTRDLLDVANRVAAVDGDVNGRERAVISELQGRCHRG